MLVMVMMIKKNYDIDDADNRNTDYRNNIDRVENEHTNLTRKKKRVRNGSPARKRVTMTLNSLK